MKMNDENQKRIRRRRRLVDEFEQLCQEAIDLRDESEIGAEIVAQNDFAQRLINREWDLEKIQRKDIALLHGALKGLRERIADAKHYLHEEGRKRFEPFYDLLWQKYCDPKRWQVTYTGDGALFRHRSVTLKFGYDENSYVMSVIIMKYLSKQAAEFEKAVCDKSKKGVTTPSTNSEIALKKVSNEWKEKILKFMGLKPTDLS